MGGLDISGNENFTVNTGIHGDDCAEKNHLIQKSIKTMFSSFGLASPPRKIWNCGSSGALWFSTKFEKKMAALDGPGSPLSTFQRSGPLRKSRVHSGPFRATQIWNQVIEHLKEKVELKKRRYKLRNYSDCFTGTDAVDVVLHYLLSDQENFCNLSREKAIKLCQTLMNKHVFHPVGSKSDDTTVHHFEDSSSKLYHFIGPHCVKDRKDSEPCDWEDESGDRDDDCDMEEDLDDTPQKHVRLGSNFNSSLLEGDAEQCGPSTSEVLRTKSTVKRKYDSPHSEVLRTKSTVKRKYDSPHRKTKSHKLCSSSESLAGLGETVSLDRIEEIRKEVALCQLLTLVDLSFLDGVLTDEKDKSIKKILKPCRVNGASWNIMARHWSMTCAAGSISNSDLYMKLALDCIAHIPRGVSKFDTDFTKASDPVTKLQAYNMISEHYSQRGEPLFPERFLDLNIAILQHVLAGRDELVLNALQLDVILLPTHTKDELRRLLKFMSVAAEDNQLQLDNKNDNETMMLNHFTDCVFKHNVVAFKARAVFVAFFTHHVEEIFTEPKGFNDKVNGRLHEIQGGQVPIVEETVFCHQVSSTEYKRQTEDCTQASLVEMMNSVIDNAKLPLKDKKQRLRQFRKCYPQLYDRHFPGML